MPGKHWENESNNRITLREINADVKDFTDEIQDDRLQKEEDGHYQITEFVYDVQLVRLFGQYVASHEEMAAYFDVNIQTINKLMADSTTDFYKVYRKAGSLTSLSLRQMQIKSAMAGILSITAKQG